MSPTAPAAATTTARSLSASSGGAEPVIDWLTLHLDLTHLNDSVRELLANRGDRIMRITEDGEQLWETRPWGQLSSDGDDGSGGSGMQGVALQCGAALRIAGSPARVMAYNNVFGSESVTECALAMIGFVCRSLSVILPRDLSLWHCSRIDVTHNYDLGGPIAVRQALSYLRHAETRGNNISTAGTSCYWNKGSSLRAGKAYHKGPQARKQVKSKRSHYSDEELEQADRLLRLELQLGRHWLQRSGIVWTNLTPEILNAEHFRFFRDCIGEEMNISAHDDMRSRFERAAISLSLSEGIGQAAYSTFCQIRTDGYENVKLAMRRTTFYRHREVMLAAGLSKADLCAGRIIEFRRATLTLGAPVTSWEDLRKTA